MWGKQQRRLRDWAQTNFSKNKFLDAEQLLAEQLLDAEQLLAEQLLDAEHFLTDDWYELWLRT